MTHHHHRFSFEKAHKLDAPERHEEQPAEWLLPHLRLEPESVVLDLGAGTGYFARPIARELAKLGGAGRMIALDVEPRMLELLAERASQEELADRIETVTCDAGRPEPLPLASGSVSHVVLVGVYHELGDRLRTMAEVHRVLQPGGLVLIVDWDVDGRLDKGPPREHRVPAPRIEEELRASGFSGVERLTVYPNHATMRAVRSA